MKIMTQQTNPVNMNEWRTKMESLEAVPAEDSWQKLSDRLVKRKPAKKVLWYWLAAAVTVGLIFISTLHFNKQEPGKTIVKSETKPIVIPAPEIKMQKVPVVVTALKIPATKIVSTLRKKKIDPVIVSVQPVVNHILITEPTVTAISLPTEKPTTTAFPVIHINELNKRASQTDMFARNNNDPDRPHRMILSSNSSDDIIKINLTPTN
jgi:hypothetical protein